MPGRSRPNLADAIKLVEDARYWADRYREASDRVAEVSGEIIKISLDGKDGDDA